MKLYWKRSDGFLFAIDDAGNQTKILCWSKVRNELNGLRPYNPLPSGITDVYRATGNIPAMPRIYPSGGWKILGIKAHLDPTEDNGYLYPFFIETDAINQVPEWELDENLCYLRPTGRMIEDKDNGLHFSSCEYTDGCLRIATEADLRWLVANVKINDPFTVTD
jgi:hypothetical protein